MERKILQAGGSSCPQDDGKRVAKGADIWSEAAFPNALRTTRVPPEEFCDKLPA
jgi:hypothetical protein